MPEPPPPTQNIPVSWVGVDEVPVQFVNCVLTQIDDFGDLIVNFGQMTPPVLTGTTQEENLRLLERVAYVPVRAVARISMSRTRLEQVIGFLQAGLALQEQHYRLRDQMTGDKP